MQIDAEKQKRMIEEVFRSIRSLDTELLVHRYVLFLFGKMGPIPQSVIDESIAAARTNPAIANIMSQRYDKHVADLLRAIDETEFQDKVQELLRDWKPSDLPN